MAEIHDGVITDQDVGQQPAGQGIPADPAKSTESEIKAALAEPSGTAAGMSFGPEEPTAIETASDAISGLTAALVSSDAVAAEAKSQLGLSEVESALQRGLPADEVLAAALSSGVLSAQQADEFAWNAALAAEGLTEEELAEIDDDELRLSEEIDQSGEQLLAQAKNLANEQDRQRIYRETYSAEFAQGVKNHEQSIKAMREYQRELGMNKETFEALLVGVDVELSSGLLGQGPMNLDEVAIQDPRLFAASLRAAGSVILQDLEEQDAQALKQGILAQSRDIADGLEIGGQPVKAQQQPVFNEERYINAVARRAKKGRYDGPVSLPAERSIRDGFTSNGRKIHPDDLPIGDRDGGTARTRLKAALRGDKP